MANTRLTEYEFKAIKSMIEYNPNIPLNSIARTVGRSYTVVRQINQSDNWKDYQYKWWKNSSREQEARKHKSLWVRIKEALGF